MTLVNSKALSHRNCSPSVTILSSSGLKMASRGSSCTNLWPRPPLPVNSVVKDESLAMELMSSPAERQDRQTDRLNNVLSERMDRQEVSRTLQEKNTQEEDFILIGRSSRFYLQEKEKQSIYLQDRKIQ